MLEDPFAEIKEQKHQRCYWRRVGFVVFAAILVLGGLVLMLASQKARAGEVAIAKSGSDRMRLFDEPCTSPGIMSKVKPDFQERMKKGEATVDGATYPMCWLSVGGTVFALYEDGEFGQVPVEAFAKEQ